MLYNQGRYMSKIINFPFIHPLLFSLYSILYIYISNSNQIALWMIPCLVALVFLCQLFTIWLLNNFIDNYHKTAVYISLFTIWLFGYDPLRSLLYLHINNYIFRHIYFIPVWTALFILCTFIISKVNLKELKLTQYLNCFSVLLIIIQLSAYWASGIQYKNALKLINKTPIISQYNSDYSPNIYYIILDEYAGQNELKDLLGFDNSEFITALERRGFYVASTSRSNYAYTDYSIPSSLNLEYLPMEVIKGGDGKILKFKAGIPLKDMVKFNKVSRFFKSIGYSYIEQQDFDWQMKLPFSFKEFALRLLKLTIIKKPLIENYLESNDKRKLIIEHFDDLEKISDKSGPIFTYSHFMIPHRPYVFNENGDSPLLTHRVIQILDEKKLYLDQIKFTNKMILKTIDNILANSKIKPIIIIQADHGPRFLRKNQETIMELKMSILNAYYVPVKINKYLYKSISPVNSFRVILSNLFGQDFPLLKDESYFCDEGSMILTKLPNDEG